MDRFIFLSAVFYHSIYIIVKTDAITLQRIKRDSQKFFLQIVAVLIRVRKGYSTHKVFFFYLLGLFWSGKKAIFTSRADTTIEVAVFPLKSIILHKIKGPRTKG